MSYVRAYYKQYDGYIELDSSSVSLENNPATINYTASSPNVQAVSNNPNVATCEVDQINKIIIITRSGGGQAQITVTAAKTKIYKEVSTQINVTCESQAILDTSKLSSKISKFKTTITDFTRTIEEPPADKLVESNLVSASNSEAPIYAWDNTDGTTISWYSRAEKPMLGANCSNMFIDCVNLTNISGLSSWNTGNVTDMHNMFFNCRNLADISALSSWDTGNVTDMHSMFYLDYGLTDISALSSWDTGNVTLMYNMFNECTSLTDVSGINDWNINKVTSFTYMFKSCPSHPEFTKRTGTWDADGTFTPS